MVQGVNKEYIFNKGEYIEKYLRIINENIKKYNFSIIAYCIMNNHAHFLVYTENIKEFGKFMHDVNLCYASIYNKVENRCGVLFRNRYRAEPIHDTKYLINCIKYIHNNPVKANIVANCGEYKYSSYNDYMTNTGCTQHEIMKVLFGENCDYSLLFKQAFEKKFMDIDDGDSDEKEYILDGIREFQREKCTDIAEIFSNRERMKELVEFLKEYCRNTICRNSKLF